jgi:hypothetical protein
MLFSGERASSTQWTENLLTPECGQDVIMKRKILPHAGIKPLSINAMASHYINSQTVE